MHTESEAAEKWCPFARTIKIGTAQPQPGAYNRVVTVAAEPVKLAAVDEGGGVGEPVEAVMLKHGVDQAPANACCIGSRCMAWRWSESHEDAAMRANTPLTEPCPDRRGYCGLAGKQP